MMLYSTLLCKKLARAPGGHKKFMLTKLGGGGGGDRIDPKIVLHSRQHFVRVNSAKHNGANISSLGVV